MEKLPKGGLIGKTVEAYLWVREKQISLHAAYAGYFIILAVFPALLMLLQADLTAWTIILPLILGVLILSGLSDCAFGC